MTMNTLNEAFEKGLCEMYAAEKQITQALPKMRDAASDSDLAEAISSHLEETKGQADRLEQVAQKCDINLKETACAPMKALLEEGEKIISAYEEGPVRDAVLIANAQKVEHYEMATYGTLVSVAQNLGYDEAAQLLEEILEEEKSADKKLTQLAEQNINNDAMKKAA